MTLVKICGLKDAKDARMIKEIRPDYTGVILAKGYRRTVDRKTAREIQDTLNGTIPLVGVYVNENPEVVLKDLDSDLIQAAQLHGQESEDVIKYLKERTKKPVWKVFQIREEKDILEAEKSSADLVLLDSGTGSGKTFDWSLIHKIHRPFILAGGLSPENVREAIRETNPRGVDTSSGVETEGRKDKRKVTDFVTAVRKENRYAAD